jgi:hypothetical protein
MRITANPRRMKEDTVKLKNGKWANKGKDGTHGTFRTKKAADEQRKAMFAQGYTTNEARKAEHLRKRKMNEAYYGEPEVFMNTWANYNEHGADGVITPADWMSIDEAIEYFEKYAEYEPFINDTEGIPEAFGIGERSTVKDLENVKEWEDMDDYDKEVVDAICDAGYGIAEAIEKVQDGDYVYYKADDDTDFAYIFIDDIGIENLGRDTLETYFDYERFGRDLSFDFHKTENGYIRID